MKKNKLFKIIAPFAAVTMILAACGADKDSTGASTDDAGKITKIVAGTEATYAPFEYLDTKGNVVGLDAEILAAIGEEMGIETEIENTGWDAMMSQVTTGGIDMGAAAITITDERKETYDFTDPYYEASLLIVTKEDSKIEKLDELKDSKIAVQMNTTGHIAAQELQGKGSKNILAYENFSVALTEVLNGSAEAAIGDNAVILEYIKNNPDSGLKTIEDDSFEVDYFGFMVKKGNKELLDVLNEGLGKIKENGKLAEITGTEIE
ncbi:basic amino acid ABC transporter substrate-binding protein [Solibacillus sp. R5-41]|uniref:basic amino acid ABC transporter substrate-binding protein n=1 Tax=Solibacillus sp. R5-41 TaxID=2048654 RepID=UPI000C1258B6|nr:basic amino acid ABC transporter substrate-binding protein [Solibacillus sp. R5-41]ATP41727.1 basic amino acid ABC transporter substrate-binding protein [Solibacillus sp. R5-41]